MLQEGFPSYTLPHAGNNLLVIGQGSEVASPEALIRL